MGAKLTDSNVFWKAFYEAQKQISPTVFKELWAKIPAAFPEAAGYLTEHLGRNTENWAESYMQAFTTGGQSAQREEGANCIIKAHLSSNAPLTRLFKQTMCHVKWENARLIAAQCRDNINPARAAKMAKDPLPNIYPSMCSELTSYRLAFALKQV